MPASSVRLASKGTDMRYRIEIERGARNFSAYAPDVDGCVATGATEDECRQNMADALAFHFDGMLR